MRVRQGGRTAVFLLCASDKVASSHPPGGVYHGKVIFPQSYPFKPPAILMLSPSGRFAVNTRLCVIVQAVHSLAHPLPAPQLPFHVGLPPGELESKCVARRRQRASPSLTPLPSVERLVNPDWPAELFLRGAPHERQRDLQPRWAAPAGARQPGALRPLGGVLEGAPPPARGSFPSLLTRRAALSRGGARAGRPTGRSRGGRGGAACGGCRERRRRAAG